ncbi:MAG: hypothetical protein ACUVTQ_12440, partial [Desulfotomaculales bacterium]
MAKTAQGNMGGAENQGGGAQMYSPGNAFPAGGERGAIRHARDKFPAGADGKDIGGSRGGPGFMTG